MPILTEKLVRRANKKNIREENQNGAENREGE